MARLARWLATIVSSLATFGVCLWLFGFISFSWMPQAAADRWVVAAAFATVAATTVGAAMGWWASREQETAAPPSAQAGSEDSVGERSGNTTLPEPSPERTTELENPLKESRDAKSQARGADIILFPLLKAEKSPFTDETRSWDDLAKILQRTSLEGSDWAFLANSSKDLRSALLARRPHDPDLPDSIPGLVTRLHELLNIISSPVPSESFGQSLAEARQLKELIQRYLLLRKE